MSEKIEELRQVRIQKLEELKKRGIEAYPVESQRTHAVGEALKNFNELQESKDTVILAGRVKSIRIHGKLIFGNLEDQTGSVQFLLREDAVGDEKFKEFELFDIGDFMQIEGTLALSKTSEKTLEVKTYSLLSKSIRPIPAEHFGLKDLETRLRKRYLDLLVNKESRELFEKKAIFWKTIRNFLEVRGFLEVQTPVFEDVPGGAEAEPFVTHHKALDRDFYLRISLELPLKKLIVGGFEKVFEIGRIFRNEGVSTEHLQDYTQMEFYWAYSEYQKLMNLVSEMYKETIQAVTGGLTTVYDGKEIDWSGPWPQIHYFEIFQKQTGLDLNTVFP
ncbi:MAG: lysine--tRNA ligase, partial [Candidatus Doudnabacteria bacterium]|nr:lysine--tRNA ligase [Candidatus Doudnabacteria bacterium]